MEGELAFELCDPLGLLGDLFAELFILLLQSLNLFRLVGQRLLITRSSVRRPLWPPPRHPGYDSDSRGFCPAPVNCYIALAGFGVAFSLCGVLYSPLLVGQQVAATKLLVGHRFGPIQSFWLRVGALLSLVTLAVGFTPFGDWVFGGVMGVSGDILDEARSAIALLAPVPLLTAARAAPPCWRCWQPC